MSSQLRRVGKSLLKYFKPIRVAFPHDAPRMPDAHVTIQELPEEGKKAVPRSFADLRKKGQPGKGDNKLGFSKLVEEPAVSGAKPEAASDLPPPLPKKETKHWLSLVTHLLLACRKLTDRMEWGRGVSTYRAMSRGQNDGQFSGIVGSIIDTLPEEEKKKRAA